MHMYIYVYIRIYKAGRQCASEAKDGLPEYQGISGSESPASWLRLPVAIETMRTVRNKGIV